jgi:DNA-binding response OmpR family regulator
MDESDVLLYKNVRLHAVSRKVFIRNASIRLRNKEYSLLEYFMKNCGIVLSRTRLLEDVWDRNIICPTNTVDVHVSSLRHKLRKYANLVPIKTIHCIGYFFGE